MAEPLKSFLLSGGRASSCGRYRTRAAFLPVAGVHQRWDCRARGAGAIGSWEAHRSCAQCPSAPRLPRSYRYPSSFPGTGARNGRTHRRWYGPVLLPAPRVIRGRERARPLRPVDARAIRAYQALQRRIQYPLVHRKGSGSHVRRPARVDDRWERSCSSSRLGGHAASASLGKAGRVARREPRASPRASGTPQGRPLDIRPSQRGQQFKRPRQGASAAARSYLCGLARFRVCRPSRACRARAEERGEAS